MHVADMRPAMRARALLLLVVVVLVLVLAEAARVCCGAAHPSVLQADGEASAPPPPLSAVHINGQSKRFEDADGRELLFHGVNAVYKVPPYHPDVSKFDAQLSLTDEDAANMAAWGFNVVRLYAAWPGAVPAPGAWNDTYIDTLQGIVSSLASHGIHTLLDCHQDVLARRFCGEGMPEHLVVDDSDTLQFPQPVLPYPFPLGARASVCARASLCVCVCRLRSSLRRADTTDGFPDWSECLKHPFFEYYASEQVGNAFQHLYDNSSGLMDHFVDFWSGVGKAFAGNPNVLGLELLNEPVRVRVPAGDGVGAGAGAASLCGRACVRDSGWATSSACRGCWSPVGPTSTTWCVRSCAATRPSRARR
jgi:hypothetical protein